MKRETLFRALVAPLLMTCLTAAAQEQGYWRAASTTAHNVTGDLTLSEERLTINFYMTPMSRIRAMTAPEVSSVFDVDSSAAGAGSLYRLDIPGDKKFQHRNSLCGTEDVQWMVTYVAGKTLQVAFFSGAKPPVFTFEAIAGSTDKCGTFGYVR
ncbi:MAG TPA: hypothetical protein VGB69_10380 [Edaphobacter sp.]